MEYWGEKEMSKKSTSFITWLRALGVIFILLCHYTQQSGVSYRYDGLYIYYFKSNRMSLVLETKVWKHF